MPHTEVLGSRRDREHEWGVGGGEAPRRSLSTHLSPAPGQRGADGGR